MYSFYDMDIEGFTYNLVEYLLKNNHSHMAKRLAECEFEPEVRHYEYKEFEDQGLMLWVIEDFYSYFSKESNKDTLLKAINYLLGLELDFFEIKIRQQEAPENWRNELLKAKVNNQTRFKSSKYPLIKKVFDKPRNKGRYITINFRSPAEENLFEHLYNTECLFFPCPLGLSNSFNDPFYKEPDYLVCLNGKWAILEIVTDSTHSSVVNEAKRTRQFQNHNIQIRSYDYSKCMNKPQEVVDDFIDWLSRL